MILSRQLRLPWQEVIATLSITYDDTYILWHYTKRYFRWYPIIYCIPIYASKSFSFSSLAIYLNLSFFIFNSVPWNVNSSVFTRGREKHQRWYRLSCGGWEAHGLTKKQRCRNVWQKSKGCRLRVSGWWWIAGLHSTLKLLLPVMIVFIPSYLM